MKLKMVMIIVLIWFGQNSFGQTNAQENSTQENNNSKNSKVEYSEETITNTNTASELYYSDKEWKKIKNQIKRNKKRIANSKKGIHSYKKLDTIYLEIKISKDNSRITDW